MFTSLNIMYKVINSQVKKEKQDEYEKNHD